MRVPIKRVALIAFFFGLNTVLGSYFLSQFNYPLPVFATQFLSHFKLIPANYSEQKVSMDIKRQPDLSNDGVISKINSIRQDSSLPILDENEQLAKAAMLLLEEYRQHNFDTEEVDEQALERSLKKAGYTYAWVGNNIFVGPLFNDQVHDALLHDQEQLKTIKNADFTDVGVATSVETIYGSEMGVVVQLVGQPQPEVKRAVSQSSSVVTPEKKVVKTKSTKEISDEEVIQALNTYRATHGIPALQVDEHLCAYAQKRASDLVAFGGLDGHAGFRKDFEDPANPPAMIKGYSGTNIGENLAHQACKNMTTGESFVAETGTSLIEWCFDSSTKGHREAQLSKDFKNVCVRHGNNMYVVIFGS